MFHKQTLLKSWNRTCFLKKFLLFERWQIQNKRKGIIHSSQKAQYSSIAFYPLIELKSRKLPNDTFFCMLSKRKFDKFLCIKQLRSVIFPIFVSQLDWLFSCHAEQSEASGFTTELNRILTVRFFTAFRMTEHVCFYYSNIYTKVSQVDCKFFEGRRFFLR